MLRGFSRTVEKVVKRQLENAGRGLIRQVLNQTPFGAALSALESLGDIAAFERQLIGAGRSALMGTPIGAGLTAAQRANSLLGQLSRSARGRPRWQGKPGLRGASGGRAAQRRRGQRQDWHRGGWASSRQDWLQNKWRHDWRSQPRQPRGRPEGGEWMEGRLPYPVSMGSPVSRKQRRLRTKAIKAYKQRMGPVKTRTIQSSWGSF